MWIGNACARYARYDTLVREGNYRQKKRKKETH